MTNSLREYSGGFLWAADVLVCPSIHVAHEDVHHAQRYLGGLR